MIRDLKLIKNIEYLYDRKVILYGASTAGRRIRSILDRIHANTYAFCDSDRMKWNTSLDGLEVLSMERLRELEKNEEISIIITSQYVSEIMELLKKYHIAENNTFTMFGLKLCIHLNINDSRVGEAYRKQYLSAYKMWRTVKREEDGWHILSRFTCSLIDAVENDTILIYQPEKVASSTISVSLEKRGKHCYHDHMLSYNEKIHGKYKEEYLYYLNLLKSKRHLKIITLVREPIIRDLSWFAYGLKFGCKWILDEVLTNDLCEAYKNFLLQYCLGGREYGVHTDALGLWFDYQYVVGDSGLMFHWFEQEIKEVFGIDVYAHPFNKKDGYQIIQKDNIEILLLQAEKINVLERVIGSFAELPDFKLENSNESKNYEYYYVYEELKQNVKLPKEYVDFYYKNNPHMDHFYSKEDQERFLRIWRDKIVAEQ